MADVVNLNKFRKKRARAERQTEAERNRRVHGRTKAERAQGRQRRERADREAEGHRLEPPEADGD